MTDPVDQFFEREREAVPTLSPPPGRFDELQTVARHRRNRNTTMVSAAAAVVLAVAGTGAVIGAKNLNGNSNNALKPAGPTAKAAVSASATPAATSTAAPGVDPTVPADFRAWSITFASPQHGWALGSYPCASGGGCVAVIETTDQLKSWHTVALPGSTATYGLSTGHAIIRFSSATDGWIVGAERVYSTHDGGLSWQSVASFNGVGIDALEAGSGRVYALGRDGSTLWINTNQSSDVFTQLPNLDLPVAGPDSVDNLIPTNNAIAAVRRTGSATTVRYSGDRGSTWQSVTSPCSKNPKASARLFTLLEENLGRFVCAGGQVWAVWIDGTKGPKRDVTFSLKSTTGAGLQPESIAHNEVGTVVAYSGAGLQGVLASGEKSKPTPGNFGYVGLTTPSQGIALELQPSGSYWFTGNGGVSWRSRPFR